jgi:hypothetical protein
MNRKIFILTLSFESGDMIKIILNGFSSAYLLWFFLYQVILKLSTQGERVVVLLESTILLGFLKSKKFITFIGWEINRRKFLVLELSLTPAQ